MTKSVVLDYAFVHFKLRDDARKAMADLNGLNLEGQCIEICLAKPQDKKLKEKKLERQMQKQMAISGGFGFGGRPGMMGMPRFPGPGPWNMNGNGYGGGGNSYGPGPNYNHNYGNEHWNDYNGFGGYHMEVSDVYMLNSVPIVKEPYNYGMAGPGGMPRGNRGAFMGRGGTRGQHMKRNPQNNKRNNKNKI